MEALDVRGVPEEKVSYLQRLIEQWRLEAAKAEGGDVEEATGIVFATHPSKVIGRLTRREIYDHL